MNENVTIYKAKLSYILSSIFLLLFPFLLTLVTLTEGQAAESHEWIGLGGFWIICVLIIVVPFTSKLEVGNDFVRTYIFGIRTSNIQPSDVLVLDYGNLMRFGGLGYGKGIKAWIKTKSGGKRYYDIGEKFYGKEAIEHVKRVLGDNRDNRDSHD